MARPLDANIVTAQADGGRIAANILGFARVLRSAGMPIGTQKVLEAVDAVVAAGLHRPEDLLLDFARRFREPSQRTRDLQSSLPPDLARSRATSSSFCR